MTRNLTLLTDLYELTMAQGYWENGKLGVEGCFYAFVRENPFEGGYSIFCGADQVAELVEGFGVTADDVDYLASLPSPAGTPLFNPEFLEWLSDLELSVDIDCVPDGTVIFPREPIVRVTGPLLEGQLLEPAILNGINFQTLIATKAARVCDAAQGRPVSEFGLRRSQGPDGALSASRAAFVGGCSSVANVLAGKKYGIPVSGTHAHSWVMSFPTQLEAFRAYAKSMPDNCTLLVDTYDVEGGVRDAITVGLELRERGHQLRAIRIDSGDLAWLSKKARGMLDDAGLSEVGIILSNDLDEYTIESLNEQGASYTGLGVGTHLATAYGQPALGGVYKLSAVREAPGSGSGGAAGAGGAAALEGWSPRMKLSQQNYKRTIPGVLAARRYYDGDGKFAGDVIYDLTTGVPDEPVIVDPLDAQRRCRFESDQECTELLAPLVRAGHVVGDVDLSAQAASARRETQLSKLDASVRRFLNPHSYPCGIERGLFERRRELTRAMRGHDELFE